MRLQAALRLSRAHGVRFDFATPIVACITMIHRLLTYTTIFASSQNVQVLCSALRLLFEVDFPQISKLEQSPVDERIADSVPIIFPIIREAKTCMPLAILGRLWQWRDGRRILPLYSLVRKERGIEIRIENLLAQE